MVYYGGEYWSDKWNYVDCVVVALCLTATVSEHIDFLDSNSADNDIGVRIGRDVIRALRLAVFVRWMSKSMVSYHRKFGSQKGPAPETARATLDEGHVIPPIRGDSSIDSKGPGNAEGISRANAGL